MEYVHGDNSGTDDDLPPHQNIVKRGGCVDGSGRSTSHGSYARLYGDMGTRIHHIEQEAYTAVLRAFKAQSDAISWDKEGLITELRRELNVTDEEHRELLGRVNVDDDIVNIRKWRMAGGGQSIHDPIPSTSVPVSRKRQKTLNSLSSQSLNVPSSLQPSSSFAKRGSTNRGSALANKPADAAYYDPPLCGRKIMSRWPEDKNFYEAVITDYDSVKDEHALVYDINTINSTVEWVNLKEISPEDIRWEGDDPVICRRATRSGPGHGTKKSMSRGATAPLPVHVAETGRELPARDNPPSQNGIRKKMTTEIEIFHTDLLIKEVERVFDSISPDPIEIDKAKKVLKEHEQGLIDAIACLAEVADGENGGGERLGTHGQLQYNDIIGEAKERQAVS